MNDEQLRNLAARASTLGERLAGGYVTADCDGTGAAAAERRLAAWREAAAAGNPAMFAMRLAHDGLDEAAVLPLLGPIRLAEGQPLPEWARTFAWIAAALAKPAAGSLDPPHDATAAVPFEELLWPAAAAAGERLAARIGPAFVELFAAPARAGLLRLLLGRLGHYCARALFWEFSAFRYCSRDQWLTPTGGAAPKKPTRTVYYRFVGDWRRYSHDFFNAKPVLARIVATIVVNWLGASAELVERLARDRRDIADVFAAGADLGPVTTLEAGLSDPHRGGRTVAVLGFDNGVKIVYKPKDLRVDAAWADLLRQLNADGAPVELKAPEVLVRRGYGWANYIEPDAADATPDDAKGDDATGDDALFRHRAGALLAVLHLLRGADFHNENVIVSNGHPIPVDLETLLHPQWPNRSAETVADPAVAAATERLANSVLMTLYLPHWAYGLAGGPVAIGGLDAPPGSNTGIGAFRYVNSDNMEFVGGHVQSSARPPPRAAANAGDIVTGFAAMYRFLLRHKDSLASADGALPRFAGLRVRAVPAGTALYAGVLHRAADPGNLADGADWSLHFDFLARKLPIDGPSKQDWQVLAAERAALTRLDVPFFGRRPTNAGSTPATATGSSTFSTPRRWRRRWRAPLPFPRRTSPFRSG